MFKICYRVLYCTRQWFISLSKERVTCISLGNGHLYTIEKGHFCINGKGSFVYQCKMVICVSMQNGHLCIIEKGHLCIIGKGSFVYNWKMTICVSLGSDHMCINKKACNIEKGSFVYHWERIILYYYESVIWLSLWKGNCVSLSIYIKRGSIWLPLWQIMTLCDYFNQTSWRSNILKEVWQFCKFVNFSNPL